MKNTKIYLLAVSMLMAGACTEDFESINTNPNSPTEVPPSYLLTHAERGLREIFNTSGLLYAQMWSETQYTNTSRYDVEPLDFSEYYRGTQLATETSNGGLYDLQEIIRLNTDEETREAVSAFGSNNNQIAVARILKAWTYHRLTDIWGDIPYSEALKGRENFLPSYDAQSDIYADLITELDEATAQIEEGAAGVEGDAIYSGDMAKWKLFAQSLKLRIGIRMSDVAPDAAQAAITSALSQGVFTSNADNAYFQNLSDAANDNQYYEHFLTRTDYAISNVMDEYMSAISDPRLNIYASPTGGSLEAFTADRSAELVVEGMPYGVNQATAGSITNNSISFPSAVVRSATSPSLIMTYPEVLFIQAEAAARGWIGGDAATLYEQAITASMEFWNDQSMSTDYAAIYGVSGIESSFDVAITAEEIATYLQQPAVAFTQANALQQIAEQKWVALYMQGLEAWSEWRRTGYPELQRAPDAFDGREIPRRRGYGQIEFDLNQTNYEAAVARQGPNTMSTRLWWDQ
ncbi:SusD/RagB family nutrient-binding outer membrane lipoprotein [Catalinimonas niigatensis]|uniref:SusD/RagB family nutrient-binding outer membrane lipoprotein n=1 Tax=Catalinimonas niigatensis TaxID=1397264 RepID=UPI002666BEC2|nr:SusD/RagB family nutrient-binding outer membrane lipoprotein [Catalinimonas niigatensis]WPP49264.1 SusD/RagB family nutrient-binding outer membrane lipoprotein [Catalinimonas niigatensis]